MKQSRFLAKKKKKKKKKENVLFSISFFYFIFRSGTLKTEKQIGLLEIRDHKRPSCPAVGNKVLYMNTFFEFLFSICLFIYLLFIHFYVIYFVLENVSIPTSW